MIFCYEIIKEDPATGKKSGKVKEYYSNRPLSVGSMYIHLRDLKGSYRVLKEKEVKD